MLRFCFRLLPLLIAGTSACHTQTPAPASPKPAAAGFERYMPLKNDIVFTYETVSEDTGERGVLMLRVRRSHGNIAEIGAGSRVQRVEIAPDGLHHLTGGFLLKPPLSPGKTWRGQFGEVTVVSTTRTVRVPAGAFTNCLETVEQARPPTQKKVTTVFCPDVGIVLLDAEGMAGDTYTHERAELRSHGPAVDLSVEIPK